MIAVRDVDEALGAKFSTGDGAAKAEPAAAKAAIVLKVFILIVGLLIDLISGYWNTEEVEIEIVELKGKKVTIVKRFGERPEESERRFKKDLIRSILINGNYNERQCQ